MELADCTLALNHFGTTVPKNDITPAEAQILRRQFSDLCGTNPILDLRITGKAMMNEHDDEDETDEETGVVKHKQRERTSDEEMLRLRSKYDSRLIEKMFPGENPNLPETFAKARIPLGQGWQAPTKAPEAKRFSFPNTKEEVQEFSDNMVVKM